MTLTFQGFRNTNAYTSAQKGTMVILKGRIMVKSKVVNMA